MKTASIIYNSKHGTTKAYAENIASLLGDWDIKAQAVSIDEWQIQHIAEADFILLGCWTSGLFFFGQKPEKKWEVFAKTLPPMQNAKVGLFTTYRLASGSMFKGMAKQLEGKVGSIDIKLKAKGSQLSQTNQEALLQFVN